ncbi:MAG: hypothetical protein JWM41_1471 [Gemmatimonadetes bacterium]|nr:hypothetical protein [Gemmatimonadota bacterium]
MTNRLRAGLNGAAAGALATVPMSAVMLGAQRVGAMGKQPPEAIVERALEAANTEPTSTAVKATAAAAHIAFGAAAGALFGVLDHDDDSAAASVTKGVGFGLAVYAVSYAGWIPAMNILPRPKHDRKDRQSSMILAHLVYGAALGALLAAQRRSD